MLDRLILEGRKDAVLQLFGVDETDDGLEALGYYAPVKLRKGRIFKHEGQRYILNRGLKAGTYFVCGEAIPLRLEAPVTLKAA